MSVCLAEFSHSAVMPILMLILLQTFHLRAASEVERQKWVNALELAKAKAIQVS